MSAAHPAQATPRAPRVATVRVTEPSTPNLRAAWLASVPYRSAWAAQRALAAAMCNGEADGDSLLLLEHPPVYTMGASGRPEHVPGGPVSLLARGAEYVDVDRGGSVTFHGPGQLVAYPVVRLADVFPIAGAPGRGDVVRYVRALEEALVATVASFGVEACTRPPHTGVWVGDDKLAAIGVKLVSGGVTTHGLALNVTTDLRWFDHVIGCGIEWAGATSLTALGCESLTPATVAPVLAANLALVLGRRLVDDEGGELRRLCQGVAPAADVAQSGRGAAAVAAG